MLWNCVKGNSSSNSPMRRFREFFGSFINRPMSTNLRYASPKPPFALDPPKLRELSTQNAMSLPKFPAEKRLNEPVWKSVDGTNGGRVPGGVNAANLSLLLPVYWK